MRYAAAIAMALPMPNSVIASVPETAFERNAATDDSAASSIAVKTAVIPAGYAARRSRPSSTWLSRTLPIPWM